MTKFRLPKLNSLVTTLVLASIGLHGLVLALPMPSLIEEKTEEPPEFIEPEVIQVVTLPKLAKEPDSLQPPLPESPELPEESPIIQEPVQELVLTDPEILDEPELVAEIEPGLNEFDDSEWNEEPDVDVDPESVETNGEEDPPVELTLDQRIASIDSYSGNYDGTGVGDTVAAGRLSEVFQQTGEFPSPFRDLEEGLEAVTVPLQDCLDDPPGDSVSFTVQVGPDGTLIVDPEPLNSSGYDVLDEKTLEIARAADYASYHPTGETKAYSFAIQIDYEACNLASGLTTNA